MIKECVSWRLGRLLPGLAVIMISLWAGTARAQAPAGMVYVSTGRTAVQIPRRELSGTCNHWEIWLFKNGVQVPAHGSINNSSAHWGTIDGSSERVVEAKLKAGQAFDRVWDKSARIGPRSPEDLDDENPVGPICVTAPVGATAQGRRQQVNQSTRNLDFLIATALKAWDTEPNANQELREYLRNLDAIERTQAFIFRELDQRLLNLAVIDAQIRQVSAQTAGAQRMSAHLPVPPSYGGPPAAGNASAGGAWISRVQIFDNGHAGIYQYHTMQTWTPDPDGQGLTLVNVVTQGGRTRRHRLDIRFSDIFGAEYPDPDRYEYAKGWGGFALYFKSGTPEDIATDSIPLTLNFGSEADAMAAYHYFVDHKKGR